jgi:hypothetical protein
MSAAVTMRDLELERARLPPGRETLSLVNFNQSFNHQFVLASGSNVAIGNNLAGLNVGGQYTYTTAVGNNIWPPQLYPAQGPGSVLLPPGPHS